jgi:hypothetical protein
MLLTLHMFALATPFRHSFSVHLSPQVTKRLSGHNLTKHTYTIAQDQYIEQNK